MDDDFMVTTFVVIDKLLATLGHHGDVRAGASDAAVLTVAVVAARAFQRHHARALHVKPLVCSSLCMTPRQSGPLQTLRLLPIRLW